jgi:hypothetical protein
MAHSTFRNIGAALVGLTIAAIAVTPAQSLESLSLSPLGFAPHSSTSTNNYFINFMGQIEGQGCFTTAVHLPDGAKVKRIIVYYTKTSDGGMFIDFAVTKFSNGKVKYPVQETVLEKSTERAELVFPVSSWINNTKKFYGFGVCILDGDTFNGALIRYSLPN